MPEQTQELTAAELAAALKNDPECRRDPHPIYHALRAENPVLKCPDGAYYVTGYDAVGELLRSADWTRDAKASGMDSTEVLANEGGIVAQLFGSIVLFTAGEQHTRIRRAFSRTLVPRVIEGVRPVCQAIVGDLLDQVEPHGRMELTAQFAQPLALRVMCHLLGLPVEDGPRFVRWSDEVFGVLEASMAGEAEREVAERAFADSQEYIRPLIASRAAQPGDDIISTIAVAYKDGQLSEEEAIANCLFLVIAGNHTTYKTITNGFYSLLHEPDQYQALRDNPELVHGATEEILRYDAAARNALPRWATAATRVGDAQVCPGEKAIGMLNAANRDPSQFEDPDRFDITREPRINLSLGRGAHVCSGAALARIMIQCSLLGLTSRFPRMEIVGDPQRGTTWNAREFSELHVRWV